MTTPLLERAFAEAAKLPEREQDALAQWVIEELEAEKRWDESFARSQDLLAQMAAEAVAEHCEGDVESEDGSMMVQPRNGQANRQRASEFKNEVR